MAKRSSTMQAVPSPFAKRMRIMSGRTNKENSWNGLCRSRSSSGAGKQTLSSRLIEESGRNTLDLEPAVTDICVVPAVDDGARVTGMPADLSLKSSVKLICDDARMKTLQVGVTTMAKACEGSWSCHDPQQDNILRPLRTYRYPGPGVCETLLQARQSPSLTSQAMLLESWKLALMALLEERNATASSCAAAWYCVGHSYTIMSWRGPDCRPYMMITCVEGTSSITEWKGALSAAKLSFTAFSSDAILVVDDEVAHLMRMFSAWVERGFHRHMAASRHDSLALSNQSRDILRLKHDRKTLLPLLLSCLPFPNGHISFPDIQPVQTLLSGRADGQLKESFKLELNGIMLPCSIRGFQQSAARVLTGCNARFVRTSKPQSLPINSALCELNGFEEAMEHLHQLGGCKSLAEVKVVHSTPDGEFCHS